MCDVLGQPASVAEAMAMLDRALDHLNAADAASLPGTVQADVLRGLERAEAKHTAARARVLAAFAGQAAYEDDGQGSARTWLKWQTRVTAAAASGAVGWVRRLDAHPAIADALAAGDLSPSWAKQVCAWTDRLPVGKQGDADEILAAAAQAGVDLAGLGGLAQEMYERSHADRGREVPDGFSDRAVWLDTTLGGAGRLTGDLTSGCSAALDAVLESLGKRAGPEDLRTAAQRRHDALADACSRLIASGMLPGRAGAPALVYLHMTLSQLRDLPGASAAEAAWAAVRASQPGWLAGPAASAAACDATLAPVVTGYVDWAAVDQMTEVYLATKGLRPDGSAGPAGAVGGPDGAREAADAGAPADADGAPGASGSGRASGASGTAGSGAAGTAGCECICGRCTCPARAPLSPDTLARLRQTMLRLAADAMSGPGGLAAWLRHAQLSGAPGGSASQPLAIPLSLDTGEAEPVIPPALRRAVLTRHRRCTFPGCPVPATACQIHHYVPRSQGGRTALDNLGPACAFHHLIVVHTWGWTLTLGADGTVTATSPYGRILRDHDPPSQAA